MGQKSNFVPPYFGEDVKSNAERKMFEILKLSNWRMFIFCIHLDCQSTKQRFMEKSISLLFVTEASSALR